MRKPGDSFISWEFCTQEIKILSSQDRSGGGPHLKSIPYKFTYYSVYFNPLIKSFYRPTRPFKGSFESYKAQTRNGSVLSEKKVRRVHAPKLPAEYNFRCWRGARGWWTPSSNMEQWEKTRKGDANEFEVNLGVIWGGEFVLPETGTALFYNLRTSLSCRFLPQKPHPHPLGSDPRRFLLVFRHSPPPEVAAPAPPTGANEDLSSPQLRWEYQLVVVDWQERFPDSARIRTSELDFVYSLLISFENRSSLREFEESVAFFLFFSFCRGIWEFGF